MKVQYPNPNGRFKVFPAKINLLASGTEGPSARINASHQSAIIVYQQKNLSRLLEPKTNSTFMCDSNQDFGCH